MSTGKDKRQKITEKVRALLTMTIDRGASEAEALAASEMAAKLMQEYDLTYEDVEKEVADERYGARAQVVSETRVMHEAYQCAETIAKYWDCLVWSSRPTPTSSGPTALIYFGTAEETLMAHDMTNMIRNAMNTAWEAFKVSPARDYTRASSELRQSFMIGMTDRINGRLQALKMARSAAGATSRALVVVKEAVIKDKFEAYQRQTGISTIHDRDEQEIDVNGNAYVAGMMAGDEVSLQKELAKE